MSCKRPDLSGRPAYTSISCLMFPKDARIKTSNKQIKQLLARRIPYEKKILDLILFRDKVLKIREKSTGSNTYQYFFFYTGFIGRIMKNFFITAKNTFITEK